MRKKSLILVLIFIFFMGLSINLLLPTKKLQISPGLPLRNYPTLMEECLK